MTNECVDTNQGLLCQSQLIDLYYCKQNRVYKQLICYANLVKDGIHVKR